MNRIVSLYPDPAMPAEAPLAVPRQDLSRPFRDARVPASQKRSDRWLWRGATFVPAFVATALIVALFTDFFGMGGLSTFETVLISLIAFSFFWIAMSVSMALSGLARTLLPETVTSGDGTPIDVALLMPIHEEVPEDVFGNAEAMLEDLAAFGSRHRFSLFILSDSKSANAAEEEARAFSTLQMIAPSAIPVHYRRHGDNSEKKIGNIAEWVQRWGGAYEGMLVLDADSLMTAETIDRLACALAADPSVGLVQSTPRIIEAETLFGRIQQFATTVYGPLLSAGLAAWTGRDGNYWGHNAIIRTRAFAASAGLPRIGRKRDLILSHDFVEAALLRRAGWAVEMLPAAPGSYEEAPETLVDYVRRDARWCRGNLQHLRLLGTRGLHPVSRFHLFQGAMSYLVSPVWLALLFIWAVIGVGEEKSLLVYFSGNDPRPHWPELTGLGQLVVLMVMYGMLLAPKLIGAVWTAIREGGLHRFGGRLGFLASCLSEIILSVAYAPILMVQQTRAIVTSALGFGIGWRTYRGGDGRGPSLLALARFHWIETVIGLALMVGTAAGFVTLWLLPISLSLLFAVPLSRLSGLRLSAVPGLACLMVTPEHTDPPAVLRIARQRRAGLRSVLVAGLRVAAE